MLVLVVVSIAALVKNHGSLTGAPFNPGNITHGFSGLAAGFPLAIYLFIGWENSAALAEETSSPRRNVPRAVFLSIGLMMVSYVLFAYATVTGFKDNGGCPQRPSRSSPSPTACWPASRSLPTWPG
jgi:amino acid transporter